MIYSLRLPHRWQPELYEFRESDHPRDNAGKWTAKGSEIGTVHHGGEEEVAHVDPRKLQTRDTGFWGKGFYVSPNKSYAGAYGSKVSSFRMHDEASVLLSASTPDTADPQLVREVVQFAHQMALPTDKLATPRTASESEWTQAVEQWHAAVNAYAESKGFDAIRVNEDEIVVKNPGILQKLSLQLPYQWKG